MLDIPHICSISHIYPNYYLHSPPLTHSLVCVVTTTRHSLAPREVGYIPDDILRELPHAALQRGAAVASWSLGGSSLTWSRCCVNTAHTYTHTTNTRSLTYTVTIHIYVPYPTYTVDIPHICSISTYIDTSCSEHTRSLSHIYAHIYARYPTYMLDIPHICSISHIYRHIM